MRRFFGAEPALCSDLSALPLALPLLGAEASETLALLAVALLIGATVVCVARGRALCRAAARFRSLLELSEPGAALIDPSTGEVLDLNARAAGALGLKDRAAGAGKGWAELFQADSGREQPPDWPRLLERAAQGTPVDLELTCRRADSEPAELCVELRGIDLEQGRAVLVSLTDIGELRRAERALARSREQYDCLAESFRDESFAYELGPGGELKAVGPAVRSILGVLPRDLIGNGSRELAAGPLRFLCDSGAAESPEDGPRRAHTVQATTAHGTKVLRLREEELRDARGSRCGIVGVARDLTERVRAQERLQRANDELELRVGERTREIESAHRELLKEIGQNERARRELTESEERFRGLVETTADIVWETDRYGTLCYISPRSWEVLGYSPDELDGRSAYDLMPSSELARIEHILRRGPTAPELDKLFELTMVRKDGRRVVLEMHSRPLFDERGRFRGRRGISRDVTERTSTEETVTEIARGVSASIGAEFLRSLVRHLAGSLGADLVLVGEISEGRGNRVRGIVIWENGRIFENIELDLSGMPCERVVGRQVYVRTDGVRSAFPQARWLIEKEINGYIGAPLFDAKGKPLGLVAAMYRGKVKNPRIAEATLQIFAARAAAEIERVRAEARIQKLNAGLERRVLRRTAQLEAANRELGAFTYSVSHDLRAPFRHVLGYSELLIEECGDKLGGAGRRYADTIARSARRGETLINELLELSRLGRSAVQRQTIDSTALVREVWEGMRRRDKLKRVELLLEALPVAHADLAQIRRVWINLLENAVKYSGTRETARIRINGFEEKGRNWYRIEDNGVGFDQGYAGKLFRVFQRLHSDKEFAGTGVGLAIVHSIVRKHDGDVRGFGKPDLGARFEFTLESAKKETEVDAGASSVLGDKS